MAKTKPTLDTLSGNQANVLNEGINKILELREQRKDLQAKINAEKNFLKKETGLDKTIIQKVAVEKEDANENYLRDQRALEIARKALNMQTVFEFIESGDPNPSEDALENAKKLKASA